MPRRPGRWAGRRAEDRRRHLPPRHIAQPRSAAPHPCRARQHGPGGGRQVALDGQRGAVCEPEADRHALPQRARGRSRQARLRHREDPCRRAFRDRRRLTRSHRGVLEPARRDRGGDGSARARRFRRQSAHRRTRRADDAGEEARHRPRRARGRVAAPGRRSGPDTAGGLVAGAVERSGPAEREAVPEPASGAGQTIGGGRRRSCRHWRWARRSSRTPRTRRRRRPAPGAGEMERAPERETAPDATPPSPRPAAVAWAMAHLSEREAVFSRTDLFAAALAHAPGAVAIGDVGAGSRGAGEGRNAARRRPARRGGLADDRPDRWGGVRDGGAHAGRPGARPGSHAGLAGSGAPQQGAAHGRAEGRGEADPVGEGPGGRRAGLCRHRQDHNAEPSAGTGGEEGLAHGRPRALGLGGSDPGFGSRHSHRNPPDVPRPQCRRGRGAGSRRRGPGRCAPPSRRPSWWSTRARSPRPCRRATCCASRPSCVCPAWCWWATPSSSTRWMLASPSPSSRPPGCRPPRWTRSCASAIPC